MTPRKHTPLRAEHVEPHACTLPRRLRVLHHAPFFAGLSEAEISEISSLFRQNAFSPGEIIYVAGEQAANLYVVATGKVKLSRTTTGGGRRSSSASSAPASSVAACPLSVTALGFPATWMKNGRCLLSEKPGLGFDLNEAALANYPFAGTRPMARAFHAGGSVAER